MSEDFGAQSASHVVPLSVHSIMREIPHVTSFENPLPVPMQGVAIPLRGALLTTLVGVHSTRMAPIVREVRPSFEFQGVSRSAPQGVGLALDGDW